MRNINEEWREVQGYEGLYEVSIFGRVKSVERIDSSGHHRKEKILKPKKTKCGYLLVVLSKELKHKCFLVHILVAQAFIPNPDNLPVVNHINEIKTDNRVTNLEWCTQRYNIRYSQAKPVNQYSKDGEFIRRWDCINEIQYQTGFKSSFISACCKGRYKLAYGYIWRYA